jgi:hypothetical protein
MALTIANAPAGVTSNITAGAVTSGAPHQLICDSGALAAGDGEPATWLVIVNTLQGGTVDVNLTNILINIGGTNTGGIISGGTTIGPLMSTTGPSPTQQMFRLSVGNGQHVYLVIGNAAPGGGSIYVASMSLTRSVNRFADI